MHRDNYHFETILGKGTFGIVYLVRRKKDFKPFVIKVQNLSAVNALSFKTVMGEVQCLQKMRHPNIIAYHGAWRENNFNYILMEYATRCTLKDLLEKRKEPLAEQDALYLFSQITLGVHHIHSQKILHRDLKPENIMLTGRCGDVVKIGDFGVSKSFEEATFFYRGSITCRAGSFYYMAPEMLTEQSYDFKCDIWSMGVVLYEMVTKELPFPALNLVEIVRMVCNERPNNLPENTSPAVVNLISKMLRKNPVYRPKTTQLLLCPFLTPVIVRVYLNLGRCPNTAERDPENFGLHIFQNFLKPQGSTDKNL